MVFILPPELTTPYHSGQKFRVYKRPFLLHNALHPSKGFNEELAKQAVEDPEHEIFAGIAGFKALDLLAAAGKKTEKRYTKAILFDGNEAQIDAMNEILLAIKESKTPFDFAKKFTDIFEKYRTFPEEKLTEFTLHELPEAHPDKYDCTYGDFYQPRDKKELRQTLDALRADPASWLHLDNYRYIRSLVLKDDITTVIADLRDPERMHAFKKSLDEQQLAIGHFYLSSTLDFADPNSYTDYYRIRGNPKKAALALYRNVLPESVQNNINALNSDLAKDLYPPAALADEKTHFILSRLDDEKLNGENMPILQSYHLQFQNAQQIAKEAEEKFTHEVPSNEKTFSCLFKAANQVWRFMSFDSINELGDKIRHYRIFSHSYPANQVELDKKLRWIDKWLSTLAGKDTPYITLGLPETDGNRVSAEGYLFNRDIPATEKDKPGKPVRSQVFSANVFQLAPALRERDPITILNDTVTELSGYLDRLEQRGPQPSDYPPALIGEPGVVIIPPRRGNAPANGGQSAGQGFGPR